MFSFQTRTVRIESASGLLKNGSFTSRSVRHSREIRNLSVCVIPIQIRSFFNGPQADLSVRSRMQRCFAARPKLPQGIFGRHSPKRTLQPALRLIEAIGSTFSIASSKHSPNAAFYKRGAFCCRLLFLTLYLHHHTFPIGKSHASDFQMATNVELSVLRHDGLIRSSPPRTRYAGTARRNLALAGNPDSCVRDPLWNTCRSHLTTRCLFFQK